MADSGKPTVDEVIHKTDLDGCLTAVALDISGRTGDEVSYVLNNTALSGNSSKVVFKSTQDLTSGTDTSLVERKAVVDALGNYYTKSQLDTRFKQSYTVILPFSARNNGTYTFSQSIDNFDAIEVLCSGYNGTEQYNYVVIRKEDYYISDTKGANFAIYFSIGTTRRVMFSLTTTSIVCTSNEGPSRLCRVRGIVY